MAVRAVVGLRADSSPVRGSGAGLSSGHVLVVLALGFHVACAPPPPIDPDRFVLTSVAPAESGIDSIQGWLASGRLEARIDGRHGLGRLRVIHRIPHQVRADIEFSGAFGLLGARAILRADPSGLTWQEGSDSPVAVEEDEVFAPVLGVGAGVADLEMLLYGLPRIRARWPEGTIVEARGSAGDVELRALFPDGSSETAKVAGDPPSLRRLERQDPRGRTQLLVRFDSIKNVNGLPIASRLDLKAPVAGNWLRIEWEVLEANPSWPSDI